MIYLTPFAISGILIVVFYLPLFLFIAIKGRTKTAFVFSLHILVALLWGIGSFLWGSNSKMDPAISLVLWKLVYLPVLFIPVFFLHAVLLMIKRQYPFLLGLTYLQAIVFSFLTLKGYVTTLHPKLIFDSFYYWGGGRAYLWSFLIWALVASLAHILLTLHYKRSYPEQKKQIFCLMLAIIGWLGGLTNFLFGIDLSPPIYLYGNFFIPIHSTFITYAILKYQLLDIAVAIKRSVVYSILLALATGSYLLMVLVTEKFLQGVIQYQSGPMSVVIGLVLGMALIPLRNRIQGMIDRLFFPKSPFEMAQENERLLKEVARSEQLKIAATMASGIAHEIKNPLTTITTFIDHLSIKKDDPEFIKKFQNMVGSEVRRVNALANQLMDFAKPPSLKFKPTDIHSLLDEILDFLTHQCASHQVHLSKEYAAPSGSIGKVEYIKRDIYK